MTGLATASLIPPRAPIAILGVPFDIVTRDEAVSLIEGMIESGRPHYVVTPNVDFLVQAAEDVELRRILFDAHLVVCDGKPLVWASRLLGNPLPERIAGSDLAPLLIRVAATKGYRLFFLGASETSAAKAVDRLRRDYPELIIAGHYSPPFNRLLEMDHERIQQEIAASRPDILFVSFGCPKQEKWIAMHYRTLGVPVTLGVGGTIDFLAGQVKRAPLWVQQAGAEWLFRLAQEPHRLLRRYSRDLWVFSRRFLIQWLRLNPRFRFRSGGRNAALPGPENSVSHSHTRYRVIRLPLRLDAFQVRQLAQTSPNPLPDQTHCFLEAGQVEFIDSTGVGLLIQWRKRLLSMGYFLVLIAPNKVVRRTLSLLRLDEFFYIAENVAAAEQTVTAMLEAQLVTHHIAPGEGPGGPSRSLRWHGEVTAVNATKFWEKTVALCEARPSVAAWQIDLSDVRFIDSSGLGLMLRIKKLAGGQGIAVRFNGLQPAVQNVIQLAGLAEFLLGAALQRRALARG